MLGELREDEPARGPGWLIENPREFLHVVRIVAAATVNRKEMMAERINNLRLRDPPRMISLAVIALPPVS